MALAGTCARKLAQLLAAGRGDLPSIRLLGRFAQRHAAALVWQDHKDADSIELGISAEKSGHLDRTQLEPGRSAALAESSRPARAGNRWRHRSPSLFAERIHTSRAR